jgi:prepilin-type N-terminal cleavage/methylation domain-containing protein
MNIMCARTKSGLRPGFTLIELLVVIAVMSILAGLLFTGVGGIKKLQAKRKTQSELARIESAISVYQDKLHTYPPDNPGSGSLINQLYYELDGTTFDGTTYTTLDGDSKIAATAVPTAFGAGVSGFVNTTAGGGDEGRKAQKFIRDLLPSQLAEYNSGGVTTKILVASVGWPVGQPGAPLGAGSTLNPIHYVSSNPTNNTRTYDLWVDIIMGGKTNRICNWSTEALPQ